MQAIAHGSTAGVTGASEFAGMGNASRGILGQDAHGAGVSLSGWKIRKLHLTPSDERLRA